MKDETGDQRKGCVGDDVDQQVVARVTLTRPAGEDRDHADRDGRSDAREDGGEDDREEAGGDEDAVGADFDAQQIAGDTEDDEGAEQRHVPVGVGRAPDRDRDDDGEDRSLDCDRRWRRTVRACFVHLSGVRAHCGAVQPVIALAVRP